MKIVNLKIEQNGGEYYGYTTISGIPDDCEIIKDLRSIEFGDVKIEFDELIEIISIK